LISIAMPSLVCVDEDEPDAWLAHGDAGGDMVALREAKAGKLGLNTFWGEINGILPVIMAGHSYEISRRSVRRIHHSKVEVDAMLRDPALGRPRHDSDESPGFSPAQPHVQCCAGTFPFEPYTGLEQAILKWQSVGPVKTHLK
jgi:hypothetical protein